MPSVRTWFPQLILLTRLCLVLGVLFIFLLHFLDPSLNPLNTTLSEYVLGPSGVLMVYAFLSLGSGTISLSLALFLSSPPSKSRLRNFLLIFSFGIALMLAALFSTDPVGAEPTFTGGMHAFVSLLGFLLATLGCAFWTRQMAQLPSMQKYTPFAAKLSFFSALFFVGFLLSGPAFTGLTQRIFVGCLLLWQVQATRAVQAEMAN